MSLKLSTAVQYLHRPQLITPKAAEIYANRLRELDPRAFERRSGFSALMRKLAGGVRKPEAMDDDDGPSSPPPIAAYCPLWMGEPDLRLETGWAVKDGVAIMEISGPLVEHGGHVGECYEWFDGYDTIASAIADADANGAVKAMLIRFATPGGVVASSLDDLSRSLQARGPDAKPIWAHCEMACSAGYWIASQLDNVIAPALGGCVGSIGAVMVHEDWSGALSKAGVAVTSIEFPQGGQKTDFAFWKPLSEDALADLQAMINHCGEAFLAAVATGRGAKLTADKARSLKARVFNAEDPDPSRSALAIGLIDGVMSEQAAFLALRDQVAATVIPIRPAAKATGRNPAARAASTPKETTMKASASLRALAKSESDPAKKKILLAAATIAAASETDKPDAAEGDDAPADGEAECDCIGEEGCECDPDQAEADADVDAEDDPPVEDDKKKKDDTAAKSGANAQLDRARAIMALPEAKGREALAQDLAFDGVTSVARAKSLLSKAAKVSTLGGRMKDVDLSADGGKKVSEDDRIINAAFALAGVAQRKR